ncbi:small acidic protein-like [Ruditapes philippinarum]|uniref:small acidic protein-like n=1 Tax=Ruditapes philippinarum TaxID=129788 RepID=UPI00295B980A|nr:small acidic protein-like [Ruditapes philippinarum]
MSTSNESKDKTNNAKVSEKDEDDALQEKVHSANSWETADLGDDDRNQKFLRLMGAAKSQHQGRFVIGEKDVPAHKHARDKKQTEEIEQELEDQYKHTFEHRITKWSHKGLGFDDDKKSEEKTESSQSGESKQDSENKSVSELKSDDQSGKKRESSEPAKKRESSEPAKNPEIPPKKPKMMMNFVKASD